LFKITKSNLSDFYAATAIDTVSSDIELLAQFCRVEKWSADLTTGMFKIGPIARDNHGLADDAECGLLTLIRCYRTEDRTNVLEILESASFSPSRFCITTETKLDDGSSISVICLGESQEFTNSGGGTIEGVFLFPRLFSNSNNHSDNIVVPMIRQ